MMLIAIVNDVYDDEVIGRDDCDEDDNDEDDVDFEKVCFYFYQEIGDISLF